MVMVPGSIDLERLVQTVCGMLLAGTAKADLDAMVLTGIVGINRHQMVALVIKPKGINECLAQEVILTMVAALTSTDNSRGQAVETATGTTSKAALHVAVQDTTGADFPVVKAVNLKVVIINLVATGKTTGTSRVELSVAMVASPVASKVTVTKATPLEGVVMDRTIKVISKMHKLVSMVIVIKMKTTTISMVVMLPPIQMAPGKARTSRRAVASAG